MGGTISKRGNVYVESLKSATGTSTQARHQGPRIALVADGDPGDRNTMSGTPFYCARALAAHCGPVLPLLPGYEWLTAGLRYANAPVERLTGLRYSRAHSVVLARLRSARYSRAVATTGADAVFSAKDCKGVAYLRTKVPVVYWTDATFRCIRGYYPAFANLMGVSVREGELLERRALERADHVITLSDWAAESVIDDYGIPAERVSSFPFGPKLNEMPPGDEVDARQIAEPVELLLVGGDWERKGGPLAVRVLQELHRRGVRARLTVAGKRPPVSVEGLEATGYLDKNSRDGALGLDDLYRRAHFFLMPVRQEAGGSVFVEAAAHGLPCLACRTGGVPSLVREGVSGHLFDVGDDPTPIADTIVRYLNSPAQYRTLVQSTRHFHETEANWTAWGRRVAAILSQLTH